MDRNNAKLARAHALLINSSPHPLHITTYDFIPFLVHMRSEETLNKQWELTKSKTRGVLQFCWWITVAEQSAESFGKVDPEGDLEELGEAHHLVRVRQDGPGCGQRGEPLAPAVQERRGGGVDECEPVEPLAGPDRGEEAAQSATSSRPGIVEKKDLSSSPLRLL
jgi:hypothetical protein